MHVCQCIEVVMSGNELFELLNSSGGIESVMKTPAGILIHRRSDEAVTVPEDARIVRAVSEGKELELILSSGTEELYQELTARLNEKQPLNLRRVLNKIMDALSGSLVPLLPMLMAAAMFKTLASVLGPNMLKVLAEDSDLYTLLSFVGDAGFYFFPIAVGYTSSRVFGTTPILGMFLGGILIHPVFVSIAESGAPFSVYGIPARPLNYSATILPIILSNWVMSYIEKAMNRIIPEALRAVFAPFLTIAIILPIALLVLAPAGSIIGEALCNLLITLGNKGGIVTVLTIAVLAALWEFIIMGGLHWLFISSIFVVLAQNGVETIITPQCAASAFAVGGMAFGAFLRLKNKSERSAAISTVIAQMIGGVTEPALYGVGFRYRKPFIGLVAGAFMGGLYAGITHIQAYNFIPSASFLCFLNYVGGTSMNVINGIISAVIGFAVSCAVTFFVGVEQTEPAKK